MTDESYDPEPHEQEIESASPDEAAGVPADDFTSGEGLVAIAGVALLIDFVIFELIFGAYFITPALLLLAVAAALLPRLRRESVERVHRLDLMMMVLGYGIAVLGAFEILNDIRFVGYDNAGSVIGALVAYAGYAMAFLGARSIEH